MVGRKLGADGAVAVFLLHVGGAADELVAGLVIDEQRRVAADIADRAIDDRVVLEFGHLRHFGLGDHAVFQRDLGVGIGLGKGQRQRAQIDLDVAKRPVAELRVERPIGRAYNQRGIHRDQEDGAK